MIRGSFDLATRRPYVEGLLVIPALNIADTVSFLVDTGSDVTCLMPADGVRIGINYSTLDGPKGAATGIGGRTDPFTFPAMVVFTETNGYVRFYRVGLLVYPRKRQLLTLSSPLGRDVLDQWRMRYDQSISKLTFTIITADWTSK